MDGLLPLQYVSTADSATPTAPIYHGMATPAATPALTNAVYTAFVSAGVAAGVAMPWYIGAVGVALSAVLTYCNGNNPSIADRY